MKFFATLLSIFALSATTAQATGITIPSGTGLPETPIIDILTEFTDWLLMIFLVLALLSFVITGVMYLISMGNDRSQSFENAKKYFEYSVKALFIVGGSYILINSIDMFLRGAL